MFYLKNFILIIMKKPILSFCFLFLLLTVILQINYMGQLNDNYFDKFGPIKKASYFFALVSKKENVASITRKLKRLPGVDQVKLIDEKIIQQDVKKLLTNVSLSSELLSEMNYVPLKIIFDLGISHKSKKLIQQYFLRLTGKNNIFMGAIKKEKILNRHHSVLIQQYGQVVLLLLSIVLCLLISTPIYNEINKKSYLIEQFQRRKFIALKIGLFGVLAYVMMIGLIIFLFSSVFNLSGLVVVAISFAFYSIIKTLHISWI